MGPSAREHLGWTETRWKPVQEALDRGVARTARCRRIIPKVDGIGEKVIVVPSIIAGPPIQPGPDTFSTPIHIFSDFRVDDPHLNKDADLIRFVQDAAARLGALEDEEVIMGLPAGAPAPANRVPRAVVAGFVRARLNTIGAFTPINAGAAPVGGAPGGEPTGQELVRAILNAMIALNAASPGAYGLILHTRLHAILTTPPPGVQHFVQQVEQLIGSNTIAGTNALSGTLNAGETAGILFRLEPAAVEVVWTMAPQVTFVQRAAGGPPPRPGLTTLRAEEEIVVRIIDPAAIRRIQY